VVISLDDYLWFVDQALDGMIAIVAGLGDELANARPDLPGANSPYAILTHCLGVMEFWAGHLVAGRDISRDRDAEFTAAGPVAGLLERAAAARARLAADVATAEPAAPPRRAPAAEDLDLPFGRSQGAALLHVYEELSQHLGQMEVSRDVIVAGRRRRDN
jgi:Protein of unknown function (DUF664)